MIDFKQYIAEQLIGQTLRFKCECIFPLDVVGYVQDVEVDKNGEFLYTVNTNGKLMTIGSNHPKLVVESICSTK